MGHDCQSSCSHDHHQAKSNSKNGGCCECHNCNCSCHQHGKYADELLHLADEAWMDILKEKIKEEIRLNAGEQLTQLAKLVSTANHARWKDKIQGKKDYEDFETHLKSLMFGPISK